MYICFSTFPLIVSLAALAAAVPSTLVAGDSRCNTGSIQCCAMTYTTTDTTVAEITGLLRIVLPSVQGLVGLGCTPITVVGTGSDPVCTQHPVCCTDNTYDGLINVGCSPITGTLNLERAGRWPDGAQLVAAALDVSSFFPYWFE